MNIGTSCRTPCTPLGFEQYPSVAMGSQLLERRDLFYIFPLNTFKGLYMPAFMDYRNQLLCCIGHTGAAFWSFYAQLWEGFGLWSSHPDQQRNSILHSDSPSCPSLNVEDPLPSGPKLWQKNKTCTTYDSYNNQTVVFWFRPKSEIPVLFASWIYLTLKKLRYNAYGGGWDIIRQKHPRDMLPLAIRKLSTKSIGEFFRDGKGKANVLWLQNAMWIAVANGDTKGQISWNQQRASTVYL